MCDVIPSAPGPVDITVSKDDNNVRVSVSWSLPDPLNGVITKYTVKYREYDSQDDDTQNTNESTREIELSGLGEYNHVNNHVNWYVCTYVYTYIRTYIHIYVRIFMYVYISIHTYSIYLPTYIIYIYLDVNIIFTCIQMYTCVCESI